MESTLPCFYCLDDPHRRAFEGAEHVLPDSLGGRAKLPVGYVCNLCNGYFSELDMAVLMNRYIAFQVGARRIRGKKGKRRKRLGQHLKFPERGHWVIEDSHAVFQRLDWILEMEAKIGPGPLPRQVKLALAQDRQFDELRFARGIYKMAFNVMALHHGHGFALQNRFDRVRRYIRKPDKGALWPYTVAPDGPAGLHAWIGSAPDGFWGVQLDIWTSHFFVVLPYWPDSLLRRLPSNWTLVREENMWNKSSLFGLDRS